MSAPLSYRNVHIEQIFAFVMFFYYQKSNVPNLGNPNTLNSITIKNICCSSAQLVTGKHFCWFCWTKYSFKKCVMVDGRWKWSGPFGNSFQAFCLPASEFLICFIVKVLFWFLLYYESSSKTKYTGSFVSLNDHKLDKKYFLWS